MKTSQGGLGSISGGTAGDFNLLGGGCGEIVRGMYTFRYGVRLARGRRSEEGGSAKRELVGGARGA